MTRSYVRNAQAEAALCWFTAALMFVFILWVSGAMPALGFLDDVLSAGVAGMALVVFAIVYRQLRQSTWSLVGLVVEVSALTLVLAGDALQHVVFHAAHVTDRDALWAATFALRDGIGNSLCYAGLALFGGLLLAEGRRWTGILALLNAALGYLDLAFAPRLGLPPHTNFLVFVVWLVVLGGSIWRRASGPAAERQASQAA
jgi:hypothetical protein